MTRIAENVNTLSDHKYRMLIILERSDRPKYWTFNCVNCKRPTAELINSEVEAITDTFSIREITTQGVGLGCKTGWCEYVYYFRLSS